MKKLICLIIAMGAVCALCACNNTQDVHTHGHSHDHTTSITETASEQQDTQIPVTSNADSSAQQEPQREDSTPLEEGSTSLQSMGEVSEYPFTREAVGPLMQKHSVKIDIPFEQEYLNAKSNKEIVSVCENYTAKWKTVADRYYKEILYYNGTVPTDPNFSTDKEMHEYIEERKVNWEADFQKDTADYLESAKEANPQDEQKAQALCAAYKFDLQREFALEMIGIYEMLGEFNNQEF